MIEIEARLDELEQLGSARRTRLVSGPQGPRVVLDGKPVLLLCSNNYLGLADHPPVREAAAEAAMRWGVGAGASRLVSGTMTIHRRLEERLAAFERRQAALLFGSGYLANAGVDLARSRGAARSSSPTSSTTPRSSTAAASRAPRCSSTSTATWSTSSGACRRPAARGALIVTDGVFSMDGDVAPLVELVELRRPLRRAAHRRRSARHRHAWARAGAARSRTAGVEDGVDVDRRHARQGARLLRRLRRLRPRDGAVPA